MEQKQEENVVALDRVAPATMKTPQNFLPAANGNPFMTPFFVPSYPTIPYFYDRPEMYRSTMYQNPVYDYCRVVYLWLFTVFMYEFQFEVQYDGFKELGLIPMVMEVDK